MARAKRRTTATRRTPRAQRAHRSRRPRRAAAAPKRRRPSAAARVRARQPRRRSRLQPPRPTPAADDAALTPLRLEGQREGASWRQRHPDGSPAALKAHVRRQWSDRSRQRQEPTSAADWRQIWRQAEAYGSGALAGAGLPGEFAPIPLQGTAAAVLYAPAESASSPAALAALAQLPLDEIVVVAGGAQETLIEAIRTHAPEAAVAHYPFALDADVGRALGAKLTGADIVLFASAAEPAPAEALGRFLWECDGRLDVALRDLSDPQRLFHRRPDKERWHEFLNVSLNRPDLKMNTMSELPFALSRKALDAIGFSDLAVPVKAHAAALTKRLTVGVAGRLPGSPAPAKEEALRKAAGDHIEAWGAVMRSRGARLGFADRYRNRKAVGGVVNDADVHSDPDE